MRKEHKKIKKINYLKILTLTVFAFTLSSHTPPGNNQIVCTKNFWRIVFEEEIFSTPTIFVMESESSTWLQNTLQPKSLPNF